MVSESVFIRDSYKIFRERSPGFEIDKADTTFTSAFQNCALDKFQESI